MITTPTSKVEAAPIRPSRPRWKSEARPALIGKTWNFAACVDDPAFFCASKQVWRSFTCSVSNLSNPSLNPSQQVLIVSRSSLLISGRGSFTFLTTKQLATSSLKGKPATHCSTGDLDLTNFRNSSKSIFPSLFVSMLSNNSATSSPIVTPSCSRQSARLAFNKPLGYPSNIVFRSLSSRLRNPWSICNLIFLDNSEWNNQKEISFYMHDYDKSKSARQRVLFFPAQLSQTHNLAIFQRTWLCVKTIMFKVECAKTLLGHVTGRWKNLSTIHSLPKTQERFYFLVSSYTRALAGISKK